MAPPSVTAASPRADWVRHFPVYYGWVCVVLAAAAMTATLPGRTHGLGLILEPLLADLKLDRVTYGQINFVCTLLGAAFCLPLGNLIDRLGVRRSLTLIVLGLSISVLLMSLSRGPATLLATLIFVRGFGQGALSIVSMAIVGKWFQRRAAAAMGLFTVLLTIGFIASILGLGELEKAVGWRTAWRGLGVLLAMFVPLCWLIARDTPEACGLHADGHAPDQESPRERHSGNADFTWAEAVRTPVFWIFAMGTALFNLVWSSVTTYNESILAEQGFSRETAVQMMAALTGAGLIANLIAGTLATRERLGRVLAVGLVLLSISLAAFPAVTTLPRLWIYGTAMGITGGIITVVFFASWSLMFGRSQLARIQGTAQAISILASAAGPWMLAEIQFRFHSYHPGYYAFAAMTATIALLAWNLPFPQRVRQTEPSEFASAPIPDVAS